MSPGSNTSHPPAVASGGGLPSREAVVLVADVVESVRLMQADERSFIACWQSFETFVRQQLLPSLDGRLVKNLGDGLMAEFQTAQRAVQAADAIHQWTNDARDTLGGGERLSLRIGLHATRVFDGPGDIYGVGVNLAARICTLAEGGETVASSQVRDLLSDMLDADIEDLGECHLKHIDRPVRVYRLGPARHVHSLPSRQSYASSLRASIAVLPFENLLNDGFVRLGDLLADGVIGALSPSPGLQVVSRLSTEGLARRGLPLADIATRLGVRHVVSGTFAVDGTDVSIAAELADAMSGVVLWTTRTGGKWRDLFAAESTIAHDLADAIHHKLLETAASHAGARPVPALDSYELFLGGISMMHRASGDDFALSRTLLESLTERHRRVAAPHAWLAKWYVLRTLQGAADDPAEAATLALRHTQRALELEPASALALAVEGFVHGHLRKDIDTAVARLRHACAINPNEGFAWLFLGVMSAFAGESALGLEAAHRAIGLSPLDPLRYYYESLVGSCEYGAGNFEEAIRWCEASRRRNRQHLSTLRILIAAYAALGRLDQARALAAEVARLRPGYTVGRYEATSVAAAYPFGRRIAIAMREAGLP